MDTYDVWTDRLTSTLRAMGIAFMVILLGWIVVTLAARLGDVIGKEIVAALLFGYVSGRLHAWWRERRWRALKTIRSDEFPPVVRRPQVPLAPMNEVRGAPGSDDPSVKAFVEREIAATKDDELKRAGDLTAKQLQQAIKIAESKVGKERAENDGALVGAVLEVLATNYRLATR